MGKYLRGILRLFNNFKGNRSWFASICLIMETKFGEDPLESEHNIKDKLLGEWHWVPTKEKVKWWIGRMLWNIRQKHVAYID